MDDKNSASIIHRKTRVGREDFDARAMSPAKALRLSLAKAADDVLDLPLTVKTLEQMVVPANILLKSFNDDDLLILLDGQSGARGAALIDSQAVSALIEKQISGRVRPAPAGARSYTRTDAAIIAPLLDATLAGYDAQLKSHDAAYLPAGFRFGDKVDDLRSLSLALHDGRFDLYRLSVDLEEGAKSGIIMLALPCRTETRAPPPGKTKEPAGAPRAGIAQHALEATVSLDAVLARIDLPLHDICALEPGAVLPIAANRLKELELVAPPGHLVAAARLGQLGGMRAVRVILPEDERATPDEAAKPAPDTARLGAVMSSQTVPKMSADAEDASSGTTEAPPLAPMSSKPGHPGASDLTEGQTETSPINEALTLS